MAINLHCETAVFNELRQKTMVPSRKASDDTLSSLNDSDEGSNCSPLEGGKNTVDQHSCWVLKESHLFFPKIWSKRWLHVDDRFLPKLSYSHAENDPPKREKVITQDIEIKRKAKSILEVHWNDHSKCSYWRLRFPNNKERDRWARRLADHVESIAWLKDYDIGEVIGEGAMGSVFYCKKYLKDEDQHLELVLKLINSPDKNSCKSTRNEVNNHRMITSAANHVNILRYYDSYRQHHKTYLVTEYCKGGDLASLAAKKGRFTEEEAAQVFCCLIDAMKTMHSHNLLHLDIKLENILLHSNDLTDIRIADFGSSKQLGVRPHSSHSSGTIGFSAPEILKRKAPTTAADVFSCGVLLYCLLCGDMPFKGYDKDVIIKNTLAGNYNMANDHWCKVSKSGKNLILSMIEVDVSKRITIQGILGHEWFIQHNKGYC